MRNVQCLFYFVNVLKMHRHCLKIQNNKQYNKKTSDEESDDVFLTACLILL